MDDVISRLSEIRSDYNCLDEKEEPYYRALSKAIQLVSAQPQRKMGKWTVKEGELGFWDVCSVCRKIIFHKTPLYNFCPNCGADMRNADEIARDIMHEAIDHSVWSDTVNVEEMHRVVDDKYADMRGEQDG